MLSDTILYPEAVAFIRWLIRDQECKPLPASQVNGLLSIAEASQYDTLSEFIVHQRSRNWPSRQRDIKTFYLALEETLANMKQRLRGDFHLLAGGRKSGQHSAEEENELMILLAREFIQHLIAENGLLAVKGRPYQQSQQGSNRGEK